MIVQYAHTDQIPNVFSLETSKTNVNRVIIETTSKYREDCGKSILTVGKLKKYIHRN